MKYVQRQFRTRYRPRPADVLVGWLGCLGMLVVVIYELGRLL